uniref:Variant surface glycoprotein n=1 Tax=Trypanosoma brucei TaxID=5691 RepID=A0A1V0G088_9TRYP|nr:variant surface glycoprotein [Trypanosoma brucei]
MRLPAVVATHTAIVALLVLRSHQAGENAKEFKDMCDLYNLMIQPVVLPKISTTDDPDGTTPTQALQKVVDKITKLNLTVVQKEIAEVLADKTTYPTWKEVTDSKKDGYFPGSDAEKFAKMRADYEDINKQKAEGSFSQKYGTPLPQNRQTALRPTLANLANKALSLQTALQAVTGTQKTAATAARKRLVAALYGSDYSPANTALDNLEKPWTDKPDDATFPWKTGAGRDATCEKAAKGDKKAGNALATDIMCICLGEKAGSNTPCTASTLTTLTQLNSANANYPDILTAWTAITAECTKVAASPHATLTATALDKALTTLLSNLGQNAVATGTAPSTKTHGLDGSRAFLGIHGLKNAKAGCSTPATAGTFSGGDGNCIDYIDLLKGKEGIPWATAITGARTALRELQATGQQTASIIGQATAIETQMEALLLIGDSLTTVHGKESPADNGKQPTLTDADKCKIDANKTAAECTKLGCGHDATTNKCKPKPGSETTSTGTGEGAAGGTAATGCEKHATKAECDADKKDDKQNCAWRKGKEGEDDKDTEKCRNDSFLLNKKFALSMVSAAFVALLF